jgi:hypothetical protein
MTVDSRISESVSPPTASEFLDALKPETREALTALGELLTCAGMKDKDENSEAFIARCMGVSYTSKLVAESTSVSGVSKICIGLAVAELAPLATETGAGRMHYNPRWERIEIGSEALDIPGGLALYFADKRIAIRMSEKDLSGGSLIEVFVHPERHRNAREFLDQLVARGQQLNPYRGHSLKVSPAPGGELSFEVLVQVAGLSRTSAALPGRIWSEVDTAISVVTQHAPVLISAGLGCSPSLLLCGPPGTGKTLLAQVICQELVEKHGFTSIYVGAKVMSASSVSDVMDVATTSLHPCVVVVDDLDLYQRDRRAGSSTALGDLLQSLDSRPPDSRTMVIATTNDTSIFDRAAILSGRLGDAILEVDYPDRRACTRILDSLLAKLPGGDDVNTSRVVTALPDNTTGADLKSLTRRCVAVSGGKVSTDALLVTLTDGRYRQTPMSGGHYL